MSLRFQAHICLHAGMRPQTHIPLHRQMKAGPKGLGILRAGLRWLAGPVFFFCFLFFLGGSSFMDHWWIKDESFAVERLNGWTHIRGSLMSQDRIRKVGDWKEEALEEINWRKRTINIINHCILYRFIFFMTLMKIMRRSFGQLWYQTWLCKKS